MLSGFYLRQRLSVGCFSVVEVHSKIDQRTQMTQMTQTASCSHSCISPTHPVISTQHEQPICYIKKSYWHVMTIQSPCCQGHFGNCISCFCHSLSLHSMWDSFFALNPLGSTYFFPIPDIRQSLTFLLSPQFWLLGNASAKIL